MTTHELKTTPVFFQAIWAGEKTFEVRFDDRGFQRGDKVTLREFDPRVHCECPHGDSARRHLDGCAKYSGRRVEARIGWVTASTPARGSQRGFVGHGYVVLALCDTVAVDERLVAAGAASEFAAAVDRIAAASGGVR